MRHVVDEIVQQERALDRLRALAAREDVEPTNRPSATTSTRWNN
jgi:hypothetical protein